MDRINFHPVNPVILSKNASEYSFITNYVHRIGVKTKCRSNFQTSSKNSCYEYSINFYEYEFSPPAVKDSALEDTKHREDAHSLWILSVIWLLCFNSGLV